MIQGFQKIEKFFNYLLVFLLPTQLAIHFWPPFAFVFGLRVDYLSPSIYLTDILLISLFIFWARKSYAKLWECVDRNKKYILVFLLLAILNTVFSVSPLVSIFKWLKFLELGLFYIYITLRPEVFKSKAVLNTFFASLVFFSLLGIGQFVLRRTLGGVLYFLGERSFTSSTPGIALAAIGGRNFLRAYSTFAHPNSLAGFIGAGALLIGNYFRNINFAKILGLFTVALAFVLTFSTSAFIGMIFCVLVYFLLEKRLGGSYMIFLPLFLILVSMLLPFGAKNLLGRSLFSGQEVSQRLELSLGAVSSISRNFLIGTGLNTFPIIESKMGRYGFHLWTLQPVHNIFLLVLSETGIIGLLMFYLLIFGLFKKTLAHRTGVFVLPLIFILITGLFDHYWLTLQQNLLLLTLVFASISNKENLFVAGK